MSIWTQTYEISGCGELHVSQMTGRVRIQGSPLRQIRVTATSIADQAVADRLEVRQVGDNLHVEVRHHQSLPGLFSSRPLPVDLDIAVPMDTAILVASGSGNVEVSDATSVAVETGSGSAELRRVRGACRVEVGSGNVSAIGVTGDIQIETGSGNLLVSDVCGMVELETGSGNLAANNVQGARFSAETGGGNIELGLLDVVQLELESGSGNVKVEFVRIHEGGSYNLETSSGSVTVLVPTDAAAQFDVTTGSGRIIHETPVQVLHADRGELVAVMNGGGPHICIEAGSGSVNLRTSRGMKE